MRHRLFVLVVSTAALAACGDNTTNQMPDGPPVIDAKPPVDTPPPPPDARPADVFVADVFQADGRPIQPDAPPPAVDAPPPIDGPPTCPVPGGNSPACQNQAGAACDANGNAGTCTKVTGPNIADNCYMFTPSPCPVHQKCTPNTVAANIAALCTCDPAVAGECVAGGPTLQCNADKTVVLTCSNDTTDEQCLFVSQTEVCGTFKECVSGTGCQCKQPDGVFAENHPCELGGTLHCGTDVNNNDVVLVCTIDLQSECKVWKRQRSCSADGLLCGASPVDGAPACQCPAHTGTVFYSNPVPAARADFGNPTDPPCRAEGPCFAAPNGDQLPTYCAFPTLGESVNAANDAGGGFAVASRLNFASAPGGGQAPVATFSNESFPLNATDDGTVIITTSDDPDIGGTAGLSTSNAAAYIVEFNSAATPVDGFTPGVVLRANDSFRGMTITNVGRDGAADVGVLIEGGGTVRVDSVVINARDGANRLFRGINFFFEATGTVQKVNVDGAVFGVVSNVGPITLANALVTNSSSFGVVVATATMSNSMVNTSTVTGIQVTNTLNATNTSVSGVTQGACVLATPGGVTVNWSGGGANHCPTGFLSADAGNVFNISGGAIIDSTQEGVRMASTGHANLNGVTVSAASINGVHMLNTAALAMTNGSTITGAGTGILLDNNATANLTNSTVTMSVGDGIVINDSAMATLGTGATVSLSGADGVILPAVLALLPGAPPPPTPNLTANAGSLITMSTTNGIEAQIGSVVLNGASVTSNGADGVLITGTATLTSTNATINLNTGDGVHTTGTGNISITGGTIGTTTLTAQGNTGIGVHINGAHTNPVTLDTVTVSRNGKTGVVVESPATMNATDSNVNNNQGGGVRSGSLAGGVASAIAFTGGGVQNNTGGIPLTLPVVGTVTIPFGVLVTPGAEMTVEGAPTADITALLPITGNEGIGIINSGNFAGINVIAGSNKAHGVLVVTQDAAHFPRLGSDIFSVGVAGNTLLHNTWLRNFNVTGNGGSPGLLPPGGITIYRTRTDPLTEDSEVLARRFAMQDSTRTPDVSVVKDQAAGPGITIGGPSAAQAGSFCQLLAATPFACGPVDAVVVNTFIARNRVGIIIQNGGDGQTVRGENTAVQAIGNIIYSNVEEGVLVRPSIFVGGHTSNGADPVHTFNNNDIRINVTGGVPIGQFVGEIEFDAAPFDGGPTANPPFFWNIGDSTLTGEWQCNTNFHNAIRGYICGGNPPTHQAIVARSNSTVSAENITYQESPAQHPEDFKSINSTDVIINGVFCQTDPVCTPGPNFP